MFSTRVNLPNDFRNIAIFCLGALSIALAAASGPLSIDGAWLWLPIAALCLTVVSLVGNSMKRGQERRHASLAIAEEGWLVTFWQPKSQARVRIPCRIEDSSVALSGECSIQFGRELQIDGQVFELRNFASPPRLNKPGWTAVEFWDGSISLPFTPTFAVITVRLRFDGGRTRRALKRISV